MDVQGHLKQKLPFWKDALRAPSPVLEWIALLYRLPLKHDPPSFCQKNHDSTERHRAFVDEAVKDFLENRCICRVDQKPVVCSPLSAVSNSVGKLRLVLNLRYLKPICACS